MALTTWDARPGGAAPPSPGGDPGEVTLATVADAPTGPIAGAPTATATFALLVESPGGAPLSPGGDTPEGVTTDTATEAAGPVARVAFAD